MRRGEARGLRVVAARPAESEARLAFAALADLLDTVGDEILALLPPPQRNAIDVALLRADAGRAPSRRLVGTALLSILRELTSRAPVLLAVDDAQWLDPPTAAALEFARPPARVRTASGRRLAALRRDAARVRPGNRRRAPPPAARRTALRRRAAADHRRPSWRRHCRGPCSSGSPRRRAATRSTHSRSRGCSPTAEPSRSAPLPVPDDLRTLDRPAHRVAAGSDARRAARSVGARAAATAAPSTRTRSRPAERAGLVTSQTTATSRSRIPCSQPPSTRAASPAELRAVHGRLAEAVGDLEERARHLALATTAPDPEAARVLDAAAQSARERGAPDSAAELTELALRLDRRSRQSDERRLALADHLHLAGDFQRASSILEELAASCRGDMRARALLALAEIEYWRAGESVAVGHAERGVARGERPAPPGALPGGDRDVGRHERSAARVRGSARAALELLEGARTPTPRSWRWHSARACAPISSSATGSTVQPPSARSSSRRSHRLAAVDTRVVFKLGQWLRYVDDFDGARRHLARRRERRGGRGRRVVALQHPPQPRRCSSAGRATGSSPRSSRDRTQRAVLAHRCRHEAGSVWRAYVDAHLGRAVDARAAAAIGRAGRADALGAHRSVSPSSPPATTRRPRRVSATAVAARRADRASASPRSGASKATRSRPRSAQATSTARARCSPSFEAAAARSRIPWSLAVGARCRGLVLAAEGELDGAADALDRALARARRLSDAVRARADAARGRPGAAPPQAEAAGARAARTGRRAVRRARRATVGASARGRSFARTATRSAPADLTPTELRIARLAAAGLTNDAIAAEVFVSRKTVEANLGRVYRKLGIRARAQLARALDARERQAIP